jgi:glycopeptide antibiotics resistance protein
MVRVTAIARVIAATLLVMYVVFLAAVLTEYNPTVATDVVSRVELWLEGEGAPAVMTAPGRVEFLLNAAMFAPIVLLAAMTFPRHPWANWVVYGFVASGAVELLQGLYLPPRSAQFVDVVANTLGALVGALVAAPLRRFLRPAPGVSGISGRFGQSRRSAGYP